MFDLVTGNKRVVQVVLAIIILPFAFFGSLLFASSPKLKKPMVLEGLPGRRKAYPNALDGGNVVEA